MVNIAIEAAREAGRYIKENVGKIRRIEYKDGQDTNLVTEIDKNSEAIIIEKIKQHYPDHDFLGEESGGRDDLKPPTMTVVQKYVPTPRTSNSTRERFAHEPKHLHEPQRKCRTLQNFAQQIWWQNFDHGELKFVTASMPGTAIGFRRIYIESSIYKSYTEPFG